MGSCHVFGHTHYAWCSKHDNTLFLQAAVAYPRERTQRGFSLTLYDTGFSDRHSSEGVTTPVLAYDASKGALVQRDSFWSRYYATHARCPEDVRWIYRPPRNQDTVRDT